MRHNKKRENILLGILIFLFVVLVVLLIGQSRKISEERREEPEQTQEFTEEVQQSEAVTEEMTEEITEKETETISEPSETEMEGYIIIGDSHVVVTDGQGYMPLGSTVDGVIYNQNLFLVHTSLDPVMGTFEWLQGDGTDRIKEIIEQHEDITDWSIISIHGTSMVTMPDISDKYIENYKMWINETFRNYNVYIVSVPPLDEAEWVVKHPDLPPRYNKDIIDFNTKIKEALPDHYFDYYDWFLEHNDFQDEIHYTGEIYRTLFDDIIGKIRNE